MVFAVAELNERLTTLGIAVNLVTYLTATMHLGNAESANVVTNFMGTSFMLCLLGGFVADSFLGRYLTIAIFTAVQASVSHYSVHLRLPKARDSFFFSVFFIHQLCCV
jgi:dipeptide/tripeptide permease